MASVYLGNQKLNQADEIISKSTCETIITADSKSGREIKQRVELPETAASDKKSRIVRVRRC